MEQDPLKTSNAQKLRLSETRIVFICFIAGLSIYEKFLPFVLPPIVLELGLGLLIFSLVLIYTAQSQMGKSWRIGIDFSQKTEIIRHGLYRLSRNPIYVGVWLTNLGLFLVLPNLVTLICLIVGHFCLQMIIRLEEQHLSQLHGDSYRQYCSQVRRWV